ncbi:hypothetical protein CL6EHI_090370 [Entamoeba histolytica]|uniref:Intermembrane lipid transfer protein VPS13-like C-terminal domain-containing protein n=1 Tax=Entamoeba histolytica TaxID=5759 RepID=A0A175JVZ0_ENTHI|nr:hypothetical protein CL6EHI_090370 [Entamoeba histolytica]
MKKTRIRFSIKAKGVNLTISKAKFQAKIFKGSIDTTKQFIQIGIGNLGITDIEKKEECFGCNGKEECLQFQYNYGKDSTCKIDCITPTLLLAPEFIKRLLYSLKDVIKQLTQILTRREENNNNTNNDCLTNSVNSKLNERKENSFNKLVLQRNENKERNKEELMFNLIKSKLVFKNNEGNTLTLSGSLEGSVVLKNGLIDSISLFSNDFCIFSKFIKRKDIIPITTIKTFSSSLRMLTLPNISFLLDCVNIEFSNRDLDTTIKLIKEFQESIQSILTVPEEENNLIKLKLSQEGLELKDKKIKTSLKQNERFIFPSLIVSFNINKIEFVLSSEFISQEGDIIESCKSLILNTELFSVELNEKELAFNIIQTGIKYTNTSKKNWTIEPLIEPFNITGKCLIPHFKIDISPNRFLILNITPEFILTLNQLFEHWVKTIDTEYYKNKGISKIINRVGEQLILKTKNQSFIIEKDKSLEIPLINERNVIILIGTFDPINVVISLKNRNNKFIYNLKQYGNIYGYITIKFHYNKFIQMVCISSIVIFKNKTQIPLKINVNNTSLLSTYSPLSFTPIIGIKPFSFSISLPENDKIIQNFNFEYSLINNEDNEVFIMNSITPFVINDKSFVLKYKYSEKLKSENKFITPITIQILPPFTFINKLPLTLSIFITHQSTFLSNPNIFQQLNNKSNINVSSSLNILNHSNLNPSINQKYSCIIIQPFSSGSFNDIGYNDTIYYSVMVIDQLNGFIFDDKNVQSSINSYCSSTKELPSLIIGKYHFKQSIKDHTIIFDCPFYIKNSTLLPLVINDFGTINSTKGYYLYAPFNQNTNSLELIQRTVNEPFKDPIPLSLGETKYLTIDHQELIATITLFKIMNKLSSSLKISIKPQFIVTNSTTKTLKLKYKNKIITLAPNESAPVHSNIITIGIIDYYGVPIKINETNEYQILMKTFESYRIFTIQTENNKGSFYTNIYGCKELFLRLDNKTNNSYIISQYGCNMKIKLLPYHSLPFAWINPIKERKLLINGCIIDPLDIEKEYLIHSNTISIEIEGNLSIITIDKNKRKEEQVKWNIDLSLPSFGISFFGKGAKEELSLNIKSILLEIVRTDRHLGLEMQFDYIQLDFQSLDILKNPVIISPRPLDWIYDPNKSFFHIGLLLITPTKGNILQLRCISKASFTIQPLEILIEPDILQHILETLEEYPPFLIPTNNSKTDDNDPLRLIIKDAIINTIDINTSIGKTTKKPSKHSLILRLLYQAREMDVDRIPIRFNKHIIRNKRFTTTVLLNLIKEKILEDLGNLKWIVVGKLFGLRTIVNKRPKSIDFTQDRFEISSMNGIDKQTEEELNHFLRRVDNIPRKDVPDSLVKAQQSTFEYSLKDGTKNLVSSVARGVKGVWKTSVGLTDLAGTQKKQLAPAGFIGGALVGAAGIVVKPLDGIVGFFKSVNDGLTGISFGQIAKERIRPPRYCPEQLICFDYLQSQGWSMLMEADGGAFKELKFYDWIKQVVDNKIKGIIFTLKSMIGVEKEVGELTKSKWKIPYQLIESLGFDGNNIVIRLKNPIRFGKLQKKVEVFVVEEWTLKQNDKERMKKNIFDIIKGLK